MSLSSVFKQFIKQLSIGCIILSISACSDPEVAGDANHSDESCEICHAFDEPGDTHQIHISSDIPCSECHPTDSNWYSSGHMDGIVDVGFSQSILASMNDAEPEISDGRCNNIYCHGATLSGGSDPNPSFGSDVESSCGMCHGIPPTKNHIDSQECETCHGISYTDDELNKNHINGSVDML